MKGLLRRAANSGEKLEIIYLSNSHQLSQRIVKVISMSETTIQAYCYLKNQYRTFKRANILSAAPLGVRKNTKKEKVPLR